LKKISLLLLYLVCCISVYAQQSIISKAEIDSLITIADTDSLFHFQREGFALKALDLSTAIDYDEGIHQAKMSLGVIYLNITKYEKSLQYFQEAHTKAVAQGDAQKSARSAYFVGNVFQKIDELTQAKKYFNIALEKFKSTKNIRWQAICLNGLGIVALKNKNGSEGIAYLKESLKLFEDNDYINESAIPINNIGDYYFEEGKLELAKRYFEKSMELEKEGSASIGYATSATNLGLVQGNLKNYKLAHQYFDKALSITELQQFNQLTYQIYKDKAETYKDEGAYQEAMTYFEKYAILKDSIINQESSNRIAQLQVEFEAEKSEIALAKSQAENQELIEQNKSHRLLNILIGLGLLSLGLMAYLFFSKNKVKRELIEADLRNQQLESERLQKELDFKDKDLTNFALDISRKNEFSDQIHDGLRMIVNSSNPEKITSKAKELLMLTSNHLKVNEDIKEFQENVEQVNQEFFDNLLSKFPELTPNDKQLCGLIRLNLNTKDIASIRNISPKSVEMGRYRLRKKLNLDPKDSLTTFLQAL